MSTALWTGTRKTRSSITGSIEVLGATGHGQAGPEHFAPFLTCAIFVPV